MNGKEIRIGVIGCGGIAQHAHLPALQRAAHATLVAVCDPYEEVARRVGRLNGLYERDAYTHHHRILERADVDAVSICAPSTMHAEIAIAALDAGKDVLVEKPMAVTSDEARAMVQAAERAGRTLMIAYNHSYDVACAHVKKMLDGGEIGDIAYAEVFFYEDRYSWTAGALASTVRAENQKSFWPQYEDPYERLREFIHNFDSHVINLMRQLLGEPAGIEYCRWIEGSGLWAAFDYRTFKAGFKNVRLGQPDFEKGIEICGRRKRVRLDLAPPLERYTPGRVRVIDVENETTLSPFLGWRWPFDAEYEHFVSCLLDGREPMTSGRQALRDVELAEDLARMALQGGAA